MFKYQAWMRTISTFITLPFFLYGIYLLISGSISILWLLPSLIIYHISMITLSVGNHRLFTHRMFKCNRFWHWFFALWGTAMGNGSPVQWVLIHLGHHKFADTSKDPHTTTFSYFFRFKHKKIEYKIPGVKWLLKDKALWFSHKYAALIVLAVPLLASLISLKFFIFFYALPMFYHHITGGLFYIFSHNKDGAVDRYWLEFIFPFAGEWNHSKHHSESGQHDLDCSSKWYHFDLGYYVICLIKSNDNI
jgi:stearoyl-CoA desaturase (delta-9 desaturase)